MATIDDVRAGILETRIYEGMLKDGKPLELTATLLDLHNDTLPFASGIRNSGAQAFGMLDARPLSTENRLEIARSVVRAVMGHGWRVVRK